MENEKVIQVAKAKMPDFDTIINLFDMTFVYISGKSAQLSGHDPKEMVGQHISNFLTADAKSEEFSEMIGRTLSGQSVIPIKTTSGKAINVLMDFITIEVDGESFLVTRAVK